MRQAKASADPTPPTHKVTKQAPHAYLITAP